MRKVLPLRITHGDGERPTAAKLNAITEQARNGTNILEKAIGDPWNQSGDAILSTNYPLQLSNLARMIGQASYLIPNLYPPTEAFVYNDAVGDRFDTETDGYLLFPPDTGGTVTVTTGGTGFSGDRKTSEFDAVSGGNYYIDDSTGRFHSAAAMDGTEVLAYTVDTVNEWDLGQEVVPSVIPDPRQTTYINLRIEKDGTTYYAILPPRCPIDLDSEPDKPANYPLATYHAANIATAIGGDNYLWQSGVATSALDDAYYRYSLPKEIQDVWSTMSTGDELPPGFLYLWSTAEDTIIEGVSFYKPDPGYAHADYALEISSSSFDFDALDTDTEVKANYESSDLVLICCGSPITRSLWQVRAAMFKHQHNKGTTLDSTISHNDLTNRNPPDTNYVSHTARYPDYLPVWPPSRWADDIHTSLLSRGGSSTSAATKRDVYNNAMLGHLLLANADTSGADSYLDATCTDDSFKIYFGDITGASIYYSNATGVVITELSGATWPTLTANSTSDYGIYGTTAAATKYGVYGYSTVGGGVAGIATAAGKYGVYASAALSSGIYTTGLQYGIHAISTADIAVFAQGVSLGGDFSASGGIGVRATGTSFGVEGISVNSYAVYGHSSTSYGGYFTGHASGAASGRAALHIHPQAAAPTTSPAEGDIYMNGTDHKLYYYNGTAWKEITVVA